MAKVTKTDIQWADYSVNPIRAVNVMKGKPGWHCEKISDGCKNCYSATLNSRFGTGVPYAADKADLVKMYLDDRVISSMLNFVPKGPFKNGRKRPAVFPFDMTDLFGHWVPDEWIDTMMAIFAIRADVDWLVLTKRAERMQAYQDASPYVRIEAQIERLVGANAGKVDVSRLPFPNIWFGVSAENHEMAARRIPLLAATPAAVRFVSAEPLIGPIAMSPLWMRKIDWVIVGGESGQSARDCDLGWIGGVQADCLKAGVMVFVKQLGSRPVRGTPLKLDDPKGGDITEWPFSLRVRQIPGSVVE